MTEQEAMKYPLNAKHKPSKKHKEVVRQLKQGNKVACDFYL